MFMTSEVQYIELCRIVGGEVLTALGQGHGPACKPGVIRKCTFNQSPTISEAGFLSPFVCCPIYSISSRKLQSATELGLISHSSVGPHTAKHD